MADKKTTQDLIALNKDLNKEYDIALTKAKSLLNTKKADAVQTDRIATNQRLINELKTRSAQGDADAAKALSSLEATQRKLIAGQEKQIKNQQRRKTLQNEINSQLKIGLRYLMDSDKAIKSTILSLGLSGAKADSMRASFEDSAGYMARLGGSVADIGTIMQTYADETGKARAMSASMVEDVTAIGMGTGLGIEQAAKLGAQFEFMGFDAKSTMEYVQGVVDTSERMGVNTTKVLKDVSF